MKKVLILLILVTNQACSQRIKSPNNKNEIQISIIDSISFVSIIPDENFYPKGDSICTKILSNYKNLTPKLINKISDTTNTKYKYAGSYFFKVGDVSLDLLSKSYSYNELPLREILVNEFELKNPNDQLYTIYYDLFHSNSSKINLENRLILVNAMKTWYKNKK